MAAEIDTAHDVRARRVLHRRVGRHDARLLLRDGARRRARRHGAPARRPPALGEDPGQQGDVRGTRSDRREVVVDAARAALQGQVSAPRPAQPPQDRRRRRTRRIHGIAEPHRAHLRLPEEHQARPAVAGADDPAHGPGGRRRQRRLPVGLAHRDRRATHRTRAGERDRRTRPRPTRCCARSCPADPGYTTENNLRMFLSLIYGATEKVILTSPYFVPDEAMVYAITTACQRGLEVQLFVSEIRRPMARRARAALVLQRPARGGRADLPVPGAVHPALQALLDRRRHRRHRLEQHGHPLVQPERGGLAPGARRVVRRAACARSSRATGTPAASSRSRSGASEPLKATFLDGIARLTSAVN